MDRLTESMTVRGRAIQAPDEGKQNYSMHPEYEGLCDSFKALFSPKEFAWMTDYQRASITDRLCYPEVGED